MSHENNNAIKMDTPLDEKSTRDPLMKMSQLIFYYEARYSE